MASLAAKVTGLRKVKGLNLSQLAKLVPMERSYLLQIEREKKVNLGRVILRNLANALDVSIDYLDDDSIQETRSWEKVAADESLGLFLKRNDISEKERAGLQKVSFTQSAPRTLKDWERFHTGLKVYSQPSRSEWLSKKSRKLRNNVNLHDSLPGPPGANTNAA